MGDDSARLQRSPREVARWQKAQQQLLGERHDAALTSYHGLTQKFPGVSQLWFELGIAAAGELDFPLAQKAFARTEQLAPNDPTMLILLGQQYHRLRQMDLARSCFEKAVAADPSSLHARLSLATWYERDRRLDDAWECIEAAAARHPRDPQVACVRAMLLHRKSRSAEAETILRDLAVLPLKDHLVRSSICHLLATVLDESGRYIEALRWLLEGKQAASQTANVGKMILDYDRADKRRRDLLASFKPGTIQCWRQNAAPEPAASQFAFLGGHPRSGTTLLEQILGVHPEILAFDESEAFAHEIWNQLAPMQASRNLTINELDDLPAPRRKMLRERYLKSLLREVSGAPSARVLLDKNPSPTASLHLWLRVFPELKVIIALRDPRDVVVSCFFQNLQLTPTNANFLSLERTVKHYSDLMDVWLRMRELGGFDWVESRYEDVIANVETESRRITSFLGLEWHPNQARHQEAAGRKILFSPTYSDVTKPIHNRAVGRWKNYAEALAPLQERLASYCRAFDYTL
jgi:Flp pilus assembly protein TadD